MSECLHAWSRLFVFALPASSPIVCFLWIFNSIRWKGGVGAGSVWVGDKTQYFSLAPPRQLWGKHFKERGSLRWAWEWAGLLWWINRHGLRLHLCGMPVHYLFSVSPCKQWNVTSDSKLQELPGFSAVWRTLTESSLGSHELIHVWKSKWE